MVADWLVFRVVVGVALSRGVLGLSEVPFRLGFAYLRWFVGFGS